MAKDYKPNLLVRKDILFS